MSDEYEATIRADIILARLEFKPFGITVPTPFWKVRAYLDGVKVYDKWCLTGLVARYKHEPEAEIVIQEKVAVAMAELFLADEL